jgi:sugar fermentation stimulation protein A
VLLRRYKRFLADVRLNDGREVVAHVANPGAMLGLAEPGTRIWVEPNDDPRRKLDHAWKLVEHGNGTFTCVDTGLANRVLGPALAAGRVAGLDGYADIRPEQRYGQNSRVDFRLEGPDRPPAWVEVKSVTLSRKAGLAEFPDCVTARGARHLGDLADRRRAGDRAVLVFAVMRGDAREVAIAGDLDPAYGTAMAAALAAGVEVLAMRCLVDPAGIGLGPPIPVRLS